MLLGLESIVRSLRRLAHGRRLSLEPPWYFAADLMQVTVYACSIVGYIRHDARWFLGAVMAALGILAWSWKWGFICFPRRTAAGRWLDARLRQ